MILNIDAASSENFSSQFSLWVRHHSVHPVCMEGQMLFVFHRVKKPILGSDKDKVE
jgi:hypothetical protein